MAAIDPRLEELAAALGVDTRYDDIEGNRQEASPEGLLAVFQALGTPIERIADAPELLRAIQTEHWGTLLDPVVVAWNGHGVVEVRVPPHAAESGYRLTVRTETGLRSSTEGQIGNCPVIAHHEATGHQVRLVPLPHDLPLGYHTLSLELSTLRAGPSEALLISAAEQVFVPDNAGAAWGVFVPVYALKSARSQGIGDLSDLKNVIAWVNEQGGSVVGTLPMLASFLDEPFEPSPYAPASRLAWNEVFLDLEAIPEVAASADAKRLMTGADATKLRASLSEPHVDYKAVAVFKRAVLEIAAKSCFAEGGPRLAALEKFAKEHPHIHDYARFRAVQEQQRHGWPVWPDKLSYEVLRDADVPQAAYRYHLYVQWNMHEQLTGLCQAARGRGYGLYLDLPVGVHGDSFDTWRFPNAFARKLSAGAPPDTLFAGGQNWGFPPLHPTRLRQDRYAYLIDILRNHLRYAKVLRIDHVMGLHRLYSIPHGATAKQGVYIRYRPEDLYAILSLESHRAGALLLGENLGTVPPAVTQSMARHRVYGMHVLQYASTPQQPTPEIDPLEVASLNTHDMPPFASFWQGLDIDQRHAFGWTTEAQRAQEHVDRSKLRQALRDALKLHRKDSTSADDHMEALAACLKRLGESESPLVLLTLEDLWGETQPQNVPGTYREHPNWSHRLRYALEELRELPEVRRLLARIEQVRSLAGGTLEARADVSPITDDDLRAWSRGEHDRLYEKLGARPLEVDGEAGTFFAVWAPEARLVCVMGDFNRWRKDACRLQQRGNTGLWEGWLRAVAPGDLYKFGITTKTSSEIIDKADPFAFAAEVPPKTASIVAGPPRHAWTDDEWLATRARRQRLDQPMSIYEVHLGSWRRVPEEGARHLTYDEVGDQLIDYVQRMGFTHVQMLPLMEHPFYGSWGYQTTGYFTPTSRYGTAQQLMGLVDRLHGAGIGVFFDWVPSHFPTDVHGLASFDGTPVYEHGDPRRGFHPDWKTAIFDYGRPEVQSFLLSCARFWVERFHLDGLRFDAVASMLYLDYSRKDGEWVPNCEGGRENLEAIDVLQRINELVAREFPGVHTIAEESTAWPMVTKTVNAGGLGFGLKWDMGWMHDTLAYFGRDPLYRQHHHGQLLFRTKYAWNENYVLSLAHDEVVHGKGSLLHKMPGDDWQKLANLRALYGYMFAQPGKKLLFMGSEFAHRGEWNHDTSLDWHLLERAEHRGVQAWVAHLNRLYRSERALFELDGDPAGFHLHEPTDAYQSIYAFLRRARNGATAVFVGNFTPVPRHAYRIGVPHGGFWREVANSDAAEYGGSGLGNAPGVAAQPVPAHGHPFSLELTLPPLSALILRPEEG